MVSPKEMIMNKVFHVLFGMFFWIFIFLVIILQISLKNISIEFQFFFFLVTVLLSTINQSVLSTKLYMEKRQLKNKVSFIYYFYSIVNLLFIVFCLSVISIIFLFF